MKKVILIFCISILWIGCNTNSKKGVNSSLDTSINPVIAVEFIPDSIQEVLKQRVKAYAIENNCKFVLKIAKPGASSFYTGYDGKTKKEAIDYNTPYEIGSATKMFTATSILQLIEKNKFALDDPLTKVLPNKKLYKGLLEVDGTNYIDSVKVVNLLNHTSGFPEYFDDSDEKEIELHGDASLVFTPEELIELSKQHIKEPFIPGTKFRYCNVNYMLLGMIIEKYSGMTYQEYFEKHIIVPLQLKNTYLGSIKQPERKVQGHFMGNETEMPPTLAGAAGEIISTLDDMESFIYAWYHGNLLNHKKTHNILLTKHYNEMEMASGIKYGLGSTNILDLSWGHPGQTFGIQSFAGCLPNDYSIILYLDDASVSSWNPAISFSSLLNGLP